MLIVNADDWGRNQQATDSALQCFRAGRITATSFMVFMSDSHRAAELAVQSGIDTGLHLNFTESFTSADCPVRLSKAHERVSRFLRRSKYAQLLYQPLLRSAFATVVREQVSEFTRMFGRPPLRIDGHQHMHQCANVLIDRLLPHGGIVRRNFSSLPGERNFLNRSYRRVIDQMLARRHFLTDFFFSITEYLPPLRLEPILCLAKDHSVELMTHPEVSSDRAVLLAPEFSSYLSKVPLGSFKNLAASGGNR